MSGEWLRLVFFQSQDVSGGVIGVPVGKAAHKCAVFAGCFVEYKLFIGFWPRMDARFEARSLELCTVWFHGPTLSMPIIAHEVRKSGSGGFVFCG